LHVLVLCAGNIGRSPLAAALLEAALAARLGVPVDALASVGVEVRSAGTAAPAGHGASQRGIAYAAELGVDLTGHEATQLTAQLVRDSDLILAMDRDQIDGVADLVLGGEANVSLWEGEGCEIPDPHHESDDFFRAVGDRIAAVVPSWVGDVVEILESGIET
jgi:protein-tyrosine phosphatase